MANGINKVILVGNLGRDVQVQSFDTGVKKASFSIATDESYKDKNGQKVDRTEWHNIVMWRGLADVAERYLRKGSKVYIEGRLRTRQYTDQNNITKYFTEIEAQNMLMLDRRDDDQQSYPNQSQGYQQQPQGQAPYQAQAPQAQPVYQNQPQAAPQTPPQTPPAAPFNAPPPAGVNPGQPQVPDLQQGQDDDLPF